MKCEKFATALVRKQAANSSGSKFFTFHLYLLLFFRTFAPKLLLR